MKMMYRLVLATALFLMSAGIAVGATTLEWDIDFHSHSSDPLLTKDVYDTGTDLKLATDETVSVDILVSGLEENDALESWSVKINYDQDLSVSDAVLNEALWDELFSPPTANNDKNYLSAEATGKGWMGGDNWEPVHGDDKLMFSFKLTNNGDAMNSVLELTGLGTGTNIKSQLGTSLEGDMPINLATVNTELDPIPVPAAVWLLGSGLTGLFAYRRRQSRK